MQKKKLVSVSRDFLPHPFSLFLTTDRFIVLCICLFFHIWARRSRPIERQFKCYAIPIISHSQTLFSVSIKEDARFSCAVVRVGSDREQLIFGRKILASKKSTASYSQISIIIYTISEHVIYLIV